MAPPPYQGTGTVSRSAGTYSYTVTDANSCTATTTGNITQPSALTPSSSNTPILCNGGSSTVTVSATGGTPPYQGTGTVSRSAGTYSYTVTDANSCTATTTGNITQPSAVNRQFFQHTDSVQRRQFNSDGERDGGTAPYQGTGTVSRSAGTYSYTVTDANSCTATTTGNITQPSALISQFFQHADPVQRRQFNSDSERDWRDRRLTKARERSAVLQARIPIR